MPPARLLFIMPTLAGRVASFLSYRELLGNLPALRLAFGLLPEQPVLCLKSAEISFTLRRRTSDLKVFDKIFLRGEYDAPFPVEPKVIVDAGANIGLSVLYFRRAFPRARIIAIEPEPENFELLRQNCGQLPGVELIHAALWPQATTLQLVDEHAQPWACTFEPARKPGAGVPTITPEQIVRRAGGRIDFLKVDIEGAEKDLFDGPAAWLDHVGLLAIELHDRVRPGCAQAFYARVMPRPFLQEVCGENLFLLLKSS